MDRKIAEKLVAACEHALASLTELEEAIDQISDETERQELMHSVSGAIVTLLRGVRAPVLRRYPEMTPFDPEDAAPYEPTEEEVELMQAASADAAAAVDSMILRECTGQWQKTARIVGDLIPEFEQVCPDLPIAYIQSRMEALAESGRIEVVGNVWAMRYAEVRLAQEEASQA